MFSHVPMTNKVVFVTIDDGIEKDPAFIQMVKDFQIPIIISLADVLIRDDYAYFEKLLYETGYISIQNHTVTHPLDMPGLPASRQLYAISGQQEKLPEGVPGDAVHIPAAGRQLRRDDDPSASEAGLKGLMLWKEAMQITDMEYQTSAHRLKPEHSSSATSPIRGSSMARPWCPCDRLYKHIEAHRFTSPTSRSTCSRQLALLPRKCPTVPIPAT